MSLQKADINATIKLLKSLWTEAKVASEAGRWQEAESAYLQILKQEPNNKIANCALGWVYYKWNKLLLEKGGMAVQVVRRNLWKWLYLDNVKTDILYGLMLWQAKKLADTGTIKMYKFLQWWDIANLQPSHWDKYLKDSKVTYDALAVQVIRIAAKEVTKTPGINYEDILRTAEWVNLALKHDPDNLWLIYYKGKILLKSGKPVEAVSFFKNVVKQKSREGWAWHYLAEALEASGDEQVMTCACKAVAACPLDKSIQSRLHLVKLLLKDRYFEEAKALMERIYEIQNDFALKLPKEIEDLKKQSWYSNTAPADDIDKWIKDRSTEAMDFLTNQLPWVPGCVGFHFSNSKQKQRVTILLKNGTSLTASARAFGLGMMKEGDPVEIKMEKEASGRVVILDLRKRNADRWDFAEETEAVVSNVNKQKNGVHFVGVPKPGEDTPREFYCPTRILSKDNLNFGDNVCLRFIEGEKNIVFSVTKLDKAAPDELIKKIISTVEFVADDRSFAKLSDGTFVNDAVLQSYPKLNENSSVNGVAIPSFDRKKKVWGWMLYKVDSMTSCE